MLELKKFYVIGEDQQPIAVQISIDQFRQLEEILENYGLAQLIDELFQEVEDKARLSKTDARVYYQQLKQQHVDS